MPEPRISALIIARDEARNLSDCLDALDWVDERVVVVDSASVDATLTIARSRADHVLVRPFTDFASQRNAALAAASGDWVLAVDADERSSTAQADEVRSRLDGPHSGYRVPIHSEILGRRFFYSGTQLDRPLRLFRRDRGRWTGAVHETVELAGTVGDLECGLGHRTLPDLNAFLNKLNTYTSLEARQLLESGRAPSCLDLTIRPAWTFLKLYLARKGFRDGVEGFAFCALSGFSVAARHWKHRELVKAARRPA